MDWPAKLLTFAMRQMPAELSEWSAALQAELDHIQNPYNRWQFAFGCARVALFPPQREGSFMKAWLASLGIAALVALFLVVILFSFPLWEDPGLLSKISWEWEQLRGPLFIVSLNLLVFTLIFTPIVHGLRTGQPMPVKDWIKTLGAASIFGLFFIAPFVVMEWWNHPELGAWGNPMFPYALFLVLWSSPTLCFLGAIPTLRALRAEESILANPVSLLLRLVVMALLAIGWVTLILDQMPCFLGGRGC